MESIKKDLFTLYSELDDLPEKEQRLYIEKLHTTQPNTARQLEKLTNSNQDFTQVFTDCFLDVTDENSDLAVGEQLANYQLTEKLGNGGMGQVFKAQRCDGKIEQTVAIKFLHPLFYLYQSGKLLLQEAQALAHLNHPNIASIYDIAETASGNAYIIMEYVEGVTLDVYLRQNTLSVEGKLVLFNQIADAVLEAHNNQIIHADIKPSNVLITDSGQAKLIDFGVMQLSGELSQSAPKLITHYLCAMTVNYASPEQLNGQKATISSDIYGLGSLLYFMLSGESPFEEIGGTLTGKIDHISNTDAPPCTIIGKARFKPDLVSIVTKALSKQPQDRYRTVIQLIQDIEAFRQVNVVSTRSSFRFNSTIKFFYRNRIINLSLLCLVVLTLVGSVLINTKNERLNQSETATSDVTQQLIKAYSKQKSYAAIKKENKELIFPPRTGLTEKDYTQLMFMQFDSAWNNENIEALREIAEELVKWKAEQHYINPLTRILLDFRIRFGDGNGVRLVQTGEEEVGYLKQLLTFDGRLDARVYDLFDKLWVLGFIQTESFNDLLNRIEKDIPAAKVSPGRKFSLYLLKSRIFWGNKQYDTSLSLLEEAMQLVTAFPEHVTLTQYFDVLFLKVVQLDILSKPTSKTVNHMLAMAELLDKNSNEYHSIVLNAIEFVESTEQRVSIIRKLKELLLCCKENKSGTNAWHLYRLAIAGYKDDEELGLALWEELLAPKNEYDMTPSDFSHYNYVACKLGVYKYATRVKNYCFDSYHHSTPVELRKILGLGNIVLWYAHQPENEDEHQYVQSFLNQYEKLEGIYLMRAIKVLVHYYLNRDDYKQANFYFQKRQLVIKTNPAAFEQWDQRELKEQDIEIAESMANKGNEQLLTNTLAKMRSEFCLLRDKDELRIKYIDLLKSFNMPLCEAN